MKATVPLAVSQEEETKLLCYVAGVTTLPDLQLTELTVNVEAYSARQAISDGLDRIMVAMRRANMDATIVGVEALTETTHLLKRMNPPKLEIVGTAEAQVLLKVNSRQRVSQLAERPDFPNPIAVLQAGRIWLQRDIEAFRATWQRRWGRPPKSDS